MLKSKPFPVREFLSFNREMECSGEGLSLEGMTLLTPGDLLAHDRYLWVEFGLGGEGETIRALGEITERTPADVKVRFKHLFPQDKRKLAIFLDPEAMH